MIKESVDSKYCYPETNVLKNHLEIRDGSKLVKFENLVSTERLMQLQQQPIYGNFDLLHLQKIHKHIFQDVYPFPGKIREVDIAKPGTLFARAIHIYGQAEDMFKRLKHEKHPVGMKAEPFSSRMAEYMADINALHPFREGNGRTQREFVRTLGLKAGYQLEWSRVNKDALFKASVKSITDCRELSEQIYKFLTHIEPDRKLSKRFEALNRGC